MSIDDPSTAVRACRGGIVNYSRRRRLDMKKIILLVGCAIAAGLWLQSRPTVSSAPEIDATKRVTDCVVRLNGQDAITHSFALGEKIDVTGEMKIVLPTADLRPIYIAFLVVLDHPKIKDVVAQSASLEATIQGDFSKFKGTLKAPKRPGNYELRLFFVDSHNELQGMDPIRRFYRVPVTVRPNVSP